MRAAGHVALTVRTRGSPLPPRPQGAAAGPRSLEAESGWTGTSRGSWGGGAFCFCFFLFMEIEDI